MYTFESGSPYAPADGGLAKEKYVGQWAWLQQRFVIEPSKPLRFTLGGEAQRHFRASLRGEDDAGVFLPDDKNPFWVMSAYGVGDVEVSQALALHAGVRYDYFKWEFTSLPETSRLANPRAAVAAKPYAGGVTKLMGGSAFRAPTVYEWSTRARCSARAPAWSRRRSTRGSSSTRTRSLGRSTRPARADANDVGQPDCRTRERHRRRPPLPGELERAGAGAGR